MDLMCWNWPKAQLNVHKFFPNYCWNVLVLLSLVHVLLRGYKMVLLTQPHMVTAIDESVGWHCWRKMTHQLQQSLCGTHVLFWFQICSHVCIGVLRCQVLKMLFYWGTGKESYKYVPDGISVCKETFFDIIIFMQTGEERWENFSAV